MTILSLNGLFRSISIFTSIIAGIFVADFIFPAVQNHQTITTTVYYKMGGRRSTTHLGIETETEAIPVGKDLYSAAKMGAKIIVHKTRILDIVKNVEIDNRIYEPICVYNLYCALPLSALIFGILAFWRIQNGNGKYTTAVAFNVATFIALIVAFKLNQYI